MPVPNKDRSSWASSSADSESSSSSSSSPSVMESSAPHVDKSLCELKI